MNSTADPKRTAALAFASWETMRRDPQADRQLVEAARARFLEASRTIATSRAPRPSSLVLECSR
jgi:hypothetical protein